MIEITEEQIEEEQKTNLIEVVLGENGSLGQPIPARSQVVMLFYMLKTEDRNMLNHPTNGIFDSGMIRWLNKDNSPKNHLNGRKDNGDKGRIKN